MTAQITDKEKNSSLFAYMQDVMVEMVEAGQDPKSIDIKEVAKKALKRMVEFEEKLVANSDKFAEQVYSDLNA